MLVNVNVAHHHHLVHCRCQLIDISLIPSSQLMCRLLKQLFSLTDHACF